MPYKRYTTTKMPGKRFEFSFPRHLRCCYGQGGKRTFSNGTITYSSVMARQTRSWKLRPVEVWRMPWLMMAKQKVWPLGAVR